MSSWGRIGALVAPACACALALAAAVDARPSAQGTFRVTVNAQITKTWDYISSRQAGDCTIASHVVGRRTVSLRSARPTAVRVTGSPGRLRFSPALVRSVTARATQTGAVTVNERGLGCTARSHADCAAQTRTLTNQTLRFFRSGKDEISFRRSRDFGSGLSRTCPPQHREVLLEQPGVHDAQGGITERQLFERAITTQTVSGSFVEETRLEGDPDGEVVERVTWSLRFVRAR